ncbi:hypothetical protein [Streptomyces sp. A30]|uniref:hypothetical protein n=1 Tax=Streptomyces sp. A30 TaxID=2789273 RepID=UPI00397FD211
MTRSGDEPVTEPRKPGRTRWGVFAAILALPALLVAVALVLLLLWLFTDDTARTGVEKAPCAEALAFGGAELPSGADDTACEVQSGIDTRYDARFRMPRDEVRDWLAATYRDGPEPRTSQCGEATADLCLNLGPGESGGNGAVQVDITHDGPNWSRVRFVAFTL